MFDKRSCEFTREFSVPLEETHYAGTAESMLELDVVIGKVEEKKWRVFKTYTQEKIVAIATGTLYEKPTGKNFQKKKKILGGQDPPMRVNSTWRDHSEQDINGDERDAFIEAVRDLSMDVYEGKAKSFGVGADTVFTQIVIGFIVGGDIPAPKRPSAHDPYKNLRKEIKRDFYEPIGGTPDHKL